MFRSLAKEAAAQVVSWTRLDAFARDRRHAVTPYIVGYHRVVERLDEHAAFALPAMEITVSMFEKHLDWLLKNFDIVSLDDAGCRRGSKPHAAVTFDDGYSDAFYNAFPLLKRKGVPATFFVVTDLIGTAQVPVHDRLYATLIQTGFENAFAVAHRLLRTRSHDEILSIIDHLDPDGRVTQIAPKALHPMTWEMLAELRDTGMTIASHTKTHAFLTNESAERVHTELRESRNALRAHLGIEANLFAYPGGCFNRSLLHAVSEAGYTVAFTDCSHRDEHNRMLTVSRRGLWERSCIDRFGQFSPAIMSGHAAALFGRSPDCQH